jgi:hypothetical protein
MLRTARHQDGVARRFHGGSAALLAALLLSAGATAGFFAGKRTEPNQLTERKSVTSRPSLTSEAPSSSRLSSVLQTALSSDLRQRLDSCLEQQEAGAAHVPSDDPQVSDPTVEEHLRSAQAEPREPLFAEATTPRLEGDLSEVSRRFDFSFENLDCRSTRCSVQLDWPSLAAARTAFKSGFSASFTRSQCQHRMLFPDVADERARARTVLIATCEAPHKLAEGAGERSHK